MSNPHVHHGDGRRSTHGWPRVFHTILLLFAFLLLWRSANASTEDFAAGHYVRAVVTILSAAAWILGAAGVAHNGRRMRMCAWGAWIINLIAPIVTFAADTATLSPVSPWYMGGQSYMYVTTLASACALMWLTWSSPARIAGRNGG